MPEDGGRTGADGSGFGDAAQMERWRSELERDRMAALIMKPGVGYAGPGAADAESREPGEDDDSSEKSEAGGVASKAAGDAADALIKSKGNLWVAAALFVKKNPLLVIIIVCIALFLMFVQVAPIIIIMACAANQSCILDLGWEVLKSYFSQGWNQIISYFL